MQALNIEQHVIDRFWSFVDKSGDCWIWKGTKNHKGYGQFRYIKNHQASRFTWQITHGPIPEGLYACHKCDNPSCVRIDHLFLGTPSDNQRDCSAKGRRPKMPKGNRWSKENRPLRHTSVVGEAVTGSKLTAEQVREIRRLYEQGTMTQRALAVRFNINRRNINAIIRRKSWKHID